MKPLATPSIPQIPEPPHQTTPGLQFLDPARLSALLATAAVSSNPLPTNGIGSSLPTVTGVPDVFPQSNRTTSEMLQSPIFPQPNENTLKQLMTLQFSPEIPPIPPIGIPGIGDIFAPLPNTTAATSQFFQVSVFLLKSNNKSYTPKNPPPPRLNC